MQVVCRKSSGRKGGTSTSRKDFLMSDFPVNIQSLSLSGWGQGLEQGWCGGTEELCDAHMLKLSPHPHVPLMLGLLKTNSVDSFDSTKSISVPRRVSWAFFSMNTLTPVKESHRVVRRTLMLASKHNQCAVVVSCKEWKNSPTKIFYYNQCMKNLKKSSINNP